MVMMIATAVRQTVEGHAAYWEHSPQDREGGAGQRRNYYRLRVGCEPVNSPRPKRFICPCQSMYQRATLRC